jgi:hypothetical protein
MKKLYSMFLLLAVGAQLQSRVPVPLKSGLQTLQYHAERPVFGEVKAIERQAKRIRSNSMNAKGKDQEFISRRQKLIGEDRLNSNRLVVAGRVIKEGAQALGRKIKKLVVPKKKLNDDDQPYATFSEKDIEAAGQESVPPQPTVTPEKTTVNPNVKSELRIPANARDVWLKEALARSKQRALDNAKSASKVQAQKEEQKIIKDTQKTPGQISVNHNEPTQAKVHASMPAIKRKPHELDPSALDVPLVFTTPRVKSRAVGDVVFPTYIKIPPTGQGGKISDNDIRTIVEAGKINKSDLLLDNAGDKQALIRLKKVLEGDDLKPQNRLQESDLESACTGIGPNSKEKLANIKDVFNFTPYEERPRLYLPVTDYFGYGFTKQQHDISDIQRKIANKDLSVNDVMITNVGDKKALTQLRDTLNPESADVLAVYKQVSENQKNRTVAMRNLEEVFHISKPEIKETSFKARD